MLDLQGGAAGLAHEVGELADRAVCRDGGITSASTRSYVHAFLPASRPLLLVVKSDPITDYSELSERDVVQCVKGTKTNKINLVSEKSKFVNPKDNQVNYFGIISLVFSGGPGLEFQKSMLQIHKFRMTEKQAVLSFLSKQKQIVNNFSLYSGDLVNEDGRHFGWMFAHIIEKYVSGYFHNIRYIVMYLDDFTRGCLYDVVIMYLFVSDDFCCRRNICKNTAAQHEYARKKRLILLYFIQLTRVVHEEIDHKAEGADRKDDAKCEHCNNLKAYLGKPKIIRPKIPRSSIRNGADEKFIARRVP